MTKQQLEKRAEMLTVPPAEAWRSNPHDMAVLVSRSLEQEIALELQQEINEINPLFDKTYTPDDTNSKDELHLDGMTEVSSDSEVEKKVGKKKR